MNFLDRFRAGLKIPTYWPPGALADDKTAEAVLLNFQQFLVENYPAFHKATERWAFSPYSVVYRWPGTEAKNNDGNAVLFVAHYDVVPAETEKWSTDPFGATMKDGFIYGRGSLDMKNILLSIMEAAENLCLKGYKPKRDLWFAFGGDEERRGALGAEETAKWFAQRGQRFAWILDEGTPIGENQIKGIDLPLALVSIEEKGYLSLELSVKQEPGHSSRPPKTQAAAVLSRALCRIDAKPFPCNLTPTVESFFKHAAALMRPGIRSFVMRHARAFGPLFFKAAGSNPVVTAILRTTVAMTQLEGSAAENVMPSEVKAVINLRLLPPWTITTAASYIKKIVKDERVQIKIHGVTNEASPAKSTRGPGWTEIETAMAHAWPGVPLLPFIMIATTDSRYYKDLADNVFRFSPFKLNSNELTGIHGHDERISEENLMRGLQFYTKLLEVL